MKNGSESKKKKLIVKAIPWRKRISVPPTLGEKYYVSFEANKVRCCRLVEIIGNSDGGRPLRVRVEQFRKPEFKYDILYIDELGKDRASALQNCVT